MAGVAATVTACGFLSLAKGQSVSDVLAGLRAAADSDSGNWHAAVHDLYRESHEQAERSGVEIVRDVRYGVFPAQAMDLYLPQERGSGLLPVAVFVHGGKLDDGDRSAPGAEEFLFGNVATFFARHGFMAVNANSPAPFDGRQLQACRHHAARRAESAHDRDEGASLYGASRRSLGQPFDAHEPVDAQVGDRGPQDDVNHRAYEPSRPHKTRGRLPRGSATPQPIAARHRSAGCNPAGRGPFAGSNPW